MKKKKASGRAKSFIIALSAGITVYVLFAVFSPHETLIQPKKFESSDGVLSHAMRAAKSKVKIGETEKESLVYNDSYPGELFVLHGGDTFELNIQNRLDQDTNMHFHGSHVSPKGNSDNVFVQVKPGEDFLYEYHLPENHPPGLYWYHPHWHGYTENQVGGGMAGPIIVKGDIDELDGIKGLEEKVLVLTTQNNPNNDNNDPIRLVNGQLNPTITIRPGEIQRWRILNASADDFYNFSIPGVEFHIMSRDGNTADSPILTEVELMAPGDRIEILVRGPGWGTRELVSQKFNQGFSNYIEKPFATIKSFGIPAFGDRIPEELIPFEDLTDVPVDNTRTLRFSEKDNGDGPPEFLLDGKTFDTNRVDQFIELGTTEEWLLVNESDEWHPFHIHINPFQVLEVNGKAVDRGTYDDTFGVPANSTVKIKTKYKDFDGKFVLHCHILFHEDHGMMQVVRIFDPADPDSSLVNSEFDVGHTNHINPKTKDQRGEVIHTDYMNHNDH